MSKPRRWGVLSKIPWRVAWVQLTAISIVYFVEGVMVSSDSLGMSTALLMRLGTNGRGPLFLFSADLAHAFSHGATILSLFVTQHVCTGHGQHSCVLLLQGCAWPVTSQGQWQKEEGVGCVGLGRACRDGQHPAFMGMKHDTKTPFCFAWVPCRPAWPTQVSGSACRLQQAHMRFAGSQKPQHSPPASIQLACHINMKGSYVCFTELS